MASNPPFDPTLRFSDRAENFRKYRPDYPAILYSYLIENADLKPEEVVCDIGTGTGILSQMFLNRGHEVYGIEPNTEMRTAAEKTLRGQSGFHNLDGRAEDIPLADSTIDFVVVGQAFHWFDPPASKKEIQRILKPGRQIALVWNNRQIKLNRFHRDYEDLLIRFGTDYAQVSRRWVVTDAGLAAWFSPYPKRKSSLPNSKRLDLEGLRGALLSASYAPTESHPNYTPMMLALDELFWRNQTDGFVTFEYKTDVYHGRMS
jgi:SAM-dependent methyltransferase